MNVKRAYDAFIYHVGGTIQAVGKSTAFVSQWNCSDIMSQYLITTSICTVYKVEVGNG